MNIKTQIYTFYKNSLFKYAVKNANSNGCSFTKKDYWHKVAQSLADDDSISVEYIPIRYIILSLQNGDLNLASKLYDKISRSGEVYRRSDALIDQLIYASIGNPVKIAQVEEADHLLDIVESMTIVKEYQDQKSHNNSIKSFLQRKINKNLAFSAGPKETDSIEEIINTKLDSKDNVLKLLPHFKKIVPIKHRGALFIGKDQPIVDSLDVVKTFTADIVKDKVDGINIPATLGLAHDSFIEFMHLNKPDYKEYDHKKALAAALGKTINEFEYNQTHRTILKLKNLSMDLKSVALILSTQGFNITANELNKIYHAELTNEIELNNGYDMDKIENTVADHCIETTNTIGAFSPASTT